MNFHEFSYLNNDQKADAEADVARVAVHAGHDVHNRLTDRYDHTEHYIKNKCSFILNIKTRGEDYESAIAYVSGRR